ncbi:MAG: hypothetical protein L0216_03570 [Planctomycetales bacterium]|nr:hypothetical protein [Planctomycetales bacterium]
MSPKLVRFVLGAVGTIAIYGAFAFRNQELLKELHQVHGMVGVGTGAAALVIVAALSGLLALATTNPVAALLMGGAIPAGLFAARLPTFGMPPAAAVKEGEKPKAQPLEGVWLVGSPTRMKARAAERSALAHEGEARAKAEEGWKAAAEGEREKALAAVRADADAAREKAVAEVLDRARSESEKAKADALAEARKAAEGEAARLAEAARAETARVQQECEEATRQLSAAKEESGKRAATIEELHGQLTAATNRASDLEKEATAFRQLVKWADTDSPGPPPMVARILTKRFSSKDVEERRVAARLGALGGPSVKALLDKAAKDDDQAVREAALAALKALAG